MVCDFSLYKIPFSYSWPLQYVLNEIVLHSYFYCWSSTTYKHICMCVHTHIHTLTILSNISWKTTRGVLILIYSFLHILFLLWFLLCLMVGLVHFPSLWIWTPPSCHLICSTFASEYLSYEYIIMLKAAEYLLGFLDETSIFNGLQT